MSAEGNPQPDFGKPPVSEVVMSVEFQPLQLWRPPHAGRYWGRIAADYPNTDVQAPIISQRERFGNDYWMSQQRQVLVELAQPEAARYWFLGSDPTRLIQVQRDRFIVNWRKADGVAPYPRYHKVLRPRFAEEWAKFRAFVTDEKLGQFDVQQCEITYVNDIEQGQGWESFADFGRIFEPWANGAKQEFLPPLQSMQISGSYEMPHEQGRLHFAVQHLRRGLDGKEVIQLQMISRGKPKSSDEADILAWMDAGHDWAVRGFADLTTPQAHKIWERNY